MVPGNSETVSQSAQREIAGTGYCLLRDVFAVNRMCEIRSELIEALDDCQDDGLIRSRGGIVYAARNVFSIFPASRRLWRVPRLTDLLREVLGEECGLVRGLYFDKPPEQSWSLAWHKDLTIAVQRNDVSSKNFTNPTVKAGVAHVEAPVGLLQSMLTLRIHLDDVTDENGPLIVMPGSHRLGKAAVDGDGEICRILARCGDVLAMRPLLAHSSGGSHPGTVRHRRILHLEFAASQQLPDGFQWRDFEALEQ